MRYLVLLRGVNVGGKNIVPMTTLRLAAESCGCANSATHANSGNLVCDSALSAKTLRAALEDELERALGFRPECLIMPAPEFLEELGSLPIWWKEPWARQYAMFFMSGTNVDAIRNRVDEYNLIKGERLHVGKLGLYWGVREKPDINRSALKRHLMKEPFYRRLTLRTSGTCARLAVMLAPPKHDSHEGHPEDKQDVTVRRCEYVNLSNPLYIDYHDNEWGRPLHDDQALFELLILECFQAGLSWECVLNKRESFRRAYEGFDPARVASYATADVERLLADPNIIRNKLKVNASIGNARAFLQIQEEFGSFDAYIWGWLEGEPLRIDYRDETSSPLSDALSKDLKRRGMRFVGTTIMYSYLQAIGIINAHSPTCFLHASSQTPKLG